MAISKTKTTRKKTTAQQKPVTKPSGKEKIKKVMKEFKEGELNSGSKSGPKVKSREQAIAIALSEGRKVEAGKSKSKSTATSKPKKTTTKAKKVTTKSKKQ